MAEIHIEKKKSMSWLWILLAILLIAFLLWWLFWPRPVDVDPATTTIVTTPVPATSATAPPLTEGDATIAGILANPTAWVGREFSGLVTVESVPTDRGFWIQQNGQRMYVILVDEPAEVPIDINTGQQIRIRGTVRDAAYLSEVQGETLAEATRTTASQQPAYLVAGERAITIEQPAQS